MIPDIMQLDNYSLERLNIDWIEAEEKAVKYSYEIGFEVARNITDQRKFRLQFVLKMKPGAVNLSGYKIHTILMGYFSFPDSYPEKDMQLAIRYNGCAILYGILRGLVTIATGVFPQGKLNLPTVNMNVIVTEIIKKQIPKNKQKSDHIHTNKVRSHTIKTPKIIKRVKSKEDINN